MSESSIREQLLNEEIHAPDSHSVIGALNTSRRRPNRSAMRAKIAGIAVLVAAIAVTVTLIARPGQVSSPGPSGATLEGKHWELTAITGGGKTSPVAAHGNFFVEFYQNGSLYYVPFCSSGSGTWTAESGTVTFSNMANEAIECDHSGESAAQQQADSALIRLDGATQGDWTAESLSLHVNGVVLNFVARGALFGHQ